MLKKIPEFHTDEEAEEFVATADLTEFDLSEFVPVRFEFVGADGNLAVELPHRLLAAVHDAAERAGVSESVFVRWAIEAALAGDIKAPSGHS
jgi:predicted DNA binding CopG/RHH family protein